MSTLVQYPAKVHSYSIKVSHNGTTIRLLGSHGSEEAIHDSVPIGDIHFSSGTSQTKEHGAFINRGGFLNMSYPLTMLCPILMLLEHRSKLHILESGHLISENIKS